MMSPEQTAIHAVHTRWIAAVNAGELAPLLDMMATDVVFMGPGQAPFGRDGFPAGFLAAHARFELHCSSEPLEFHVAGDLGCTVCRDALTLVTREGGERSGLAGHRMTLYRRQPDGRWLLARDVHNLTPVTE